MFAVFHPWFLAQHKHFDWSCDPIALGSIGDVTEMFIDFHVLLTTLCPMFTKPTQLKHQEAAQVLHTSLTATFSVGPGIFMCWISQQIYWLISLKKMHYVSHINLYTTYPYILHIHSKSWIHTRLYKYIQYIYILYTLVKLAHLQGPLVALSFQASPDPCWSDQQRSTSPGSTGFGGFETTQLMGSSS